MKRNVCEHGFTLIEVLTTVVLLGVLAAMIVPRLVGQTDKARASEAINMLGAIRQAEEAYKNGPAGGYLQIDVDSDPTAGIACENGGNSNAWTVLSLGDPNPSNAPNSYYTYCVDSVPANGSTFRAVARLLTDQSQEIRLNQAGVWSGNANNPHVPANPNGDTCISAGGNLPDPC